MTQTILLIDDDACRRKLLGGVLQRRGHGLLFAANGREVASCLEASNCDLLLLDLDMSGESGFDMLDIAVQYRGPVVILTGQLDQCEWGALRGADVVVEKPADPEQLLQALERLLREPESRRQERRANRNGGIQFIRGLRQSRAGTVQSDVRPDSGSVQIGK